MSAVHVVTKRHRLKSDGVVIDNGRLAEVVYSLVSAVLIDRLGGIHGAATLGVSRYFHDAALLLCNRYNVQVVHLLRKNFPNLTVRVVPEQSEDWMVYITEV